ncbi:stalk domain-containing protein [Cohnella terricola]|nr:stalk domain-containing protein [Cohnella terricola]
MKINNRIMITALLLLVSFLASSTVSYGYTTVTELDNETVIQLDKASSLGNETWSMSNSNLLAAPTGFVYGKNEYVVTSGSGTIAVSPNGRDWSTLSSMGNYLLNTIEWNGSEYLIIGFQCKKIRCESAQYGDPIAFISKDGRNWNKRATNLKSEPVMDVVWTTNKYIAITQYGKALSSVDGIKWNEISGLSSKYKWNSIYTSNGKTILTTWGSKDIAVSQDGVNWAVKSNSSNSIHISNVIWNGKQFIAGGEGGVYSSTDALNWKLLSSIKDSKFNVIAYNGSKYVGIGLVGSNKVIFTSSDLKKWTQKPLQGSEMTAGLLATKDGFVGISAYNPDSPKNCLYYYSKDGQDWSIDFVSTTGYHAIATNGNRTVVVGNNGSIIYTDDGVKWNKSSIVTVIDNGYTKSMPGLADVEWGAGKFVAVGNGGIYTSKDGRTWTRSLNKFGIGQVVWTGKFFVAVGSIDPDIYVSQDGVSWNEKSIGVKNKYNYSVRNMISANGKVYLIVQNFSNRNDIHFEVLSSSDWLKWTQTRLPSSIMDVLKFAWNGENFIVGDIGEKKVYLSKDAVHWSMKQTNIDEKTPHYTRMIMNDQNMFVLTGARGLWISKNGTEWEHKPLFGSDFENDEYGPGFFMLGDMVKAHGKYIFVAGSSIYTIKDIKNIKPYNTKVISEVTYGLSIDGIETNAQQGEPVKLDGVLYVPVEPIVTGMGDTFKYISKPDAALLTKKDGTTIQINITKPTAVVNFSDIVPVSSLYRSSMGESVQAQPAVVKGKIYVPFDFVPTVLGYEAGTYKQGTKDVVYVGMKPEEKSTES